MPGVTEIPRWLVDSINNPADDSDLDQYASFDNEGSTNIAKEAVRLTNPEEEITTEEEARAHTRRIIDAYNVGREVADEVLVETMTLPDLELDRNFQPRDITNFLFGDELGAIGVRLDARGASMSVDNAVQQWSEHPIRTTLALASWAFPFAGKALQKARYGKLEQITGDELVKAGKFESIEAFGKADESAKRLARIHLSSEQRYLNLITDATHHPERMGIMRRAELSFRQNFGTKYMQLSDPSSSMAHNMNVMQRMQNTIKDEVVTPFMSEIPESLMAASAGKSLHLYMLGRGPLSALPKEAQTWAFNLREASKEAQQHALNIGMISEETAEHVGEVFTPLLRKNKPLRTQIGPSEDVVLLQGKKGKMTSIPVARLRSPALEKRNTGLDEFETMIRENKVFSDPKNLTMHGLMEQKMLTMAHEHVRDLALHPKFSATAGELADRGEKLDKWVSINYIPGVDRLRRMIGKVPGKEHMANEDRFIRLDAFEQVFGKGGLITQTGEATAALAALTRMHKFSKTALNLFTHGQNISGNMAFLSMAGFRLFTPGVESARNWQAIKSAMANINQNYKVGTGKLAPDAVKYRPIKFKERTFSPSEIAEELENPWVQDIIEKGTFIKAEASSNGNVVSKIVDGAADMNDALGKLAKSGKGFIDTSARFYNIEDAGPKFAYYLSLRARGFTPQLAATEVSRRLPIYHGLAGGPKLFGSFGPRVGPASLRKWMFPWISFPAEAMRITKNNLIDYPMRMIPWLHAPQIVQSVVYGASHGMGVGEPLSYDDHQGIRRGLPIHAQRPGAVTLPLKDRNDQFRAMMLDFLPTLSFGPATMAKEASFSDVNPYDVAPIFSGMLGIMTGEGPFGQPIAATSKSDLFAKHVSNAVGFITPPYIQKYAFNITQPREGINIRRFEQDLGQVINPSTGKPGSWIADLLLSNTVLRNYASSGEQELFNKNLEMDRTVDKVRGELTRRFNAAARSGSEDEATKYIVQVANTFVREYGPGPIAQKKFVEWVARHRKTINRHPQLRRYSKEDLQRMLIQNYDATAEQRNLGLKNTISALNQELVLRQMRP